VLANRVQLLDPNKVDPDMADQLTREKLNVVNPNEVVVPLK
jgi:cell division protein FtsB